MTIENKAHNKIDEVGGKLKEVVGKVTGDESTETEGRFDQMKANLKDAGEKVKDAFKDKFIELSLFKDLSWRCSHLFSRPSL